MRSPLIILIVGMLSCASFAAEIGVEAFGAKPGDGIDDGDAIQRAIAASKSNDTIRFSDGQYDLSETLMLRGGRTYLAADETVLRFANLPDDTYAIAIEANARDVTVRGFGIVGGGIRLSDGKQYRNIRIVENDITQTAGTPAVYCSIASERLIIERNRFHDYDDYGVIAYHIDEASVSGNVFHNIQQGAHLLAPSDNCVFSFNHGTKITRMGLEVQRMGRTIAKNMVVEGNAFYDWKYPFRDSFGLSIVADESINTRIINNYLRANFTGPWNDETATDGQGKRFGYGIEAGFTSGVVEGNIVGGPWANHIIVSHRDTLVKNNKLFGKPAWKRHLQTEGGPHGRGSFIDENNHIDPDMDDMPEPPRLEDVTASVKEDWRSR